MPKHGEVVGASLKTAGFIAFQCPECVGEISNFAIKGLLLDKLDSQFLSSAQTEAFPAFEGIATILHDVAVAKASSSDSSASGKEVAESAVQLLCKGAGKQKKVPANASFFTDRIKQLSSHKGGSVSFEELLRKYIASEGVEGVSV
eukprot:Cvel_25243.t1-p1 / transcript=Cvel_25243.t1 / gene=Cvel_25243 / organism=Chromera_velia_CCMP2878 / gene_product=hypothetical protein / transcript_product=hypothetical protein / location=Cvel_scaffold2832:10648-11082(+) / protein_length=145 / sequence_SO=supercontig / SO=protein_coding / is_pseudo=false